ncbi:hypothetical protein K8R03_03505 [Candidatus Kaiserbacteria bacterium]|nr:hypothetical protein [Candidatus Kaiserbacteria bacterium]
MGSIEKRFVSKVDEERRKSDGVHRQGIDAPLGKTVVRGGELADDNDPESLLMQKEQEEADDAAEMNMTVHEYREWLKNPGRLDKAA